jgi:phosphonate transport system ATP-binding protein
MSAPHFNLSRVSRVWVARSALREVDLSVGPGEKIVLAGPSGSGKSTLLSLLNGSLPPSSGTVRAQEVDLASLSRRALRRHRARCSNIQQPGTLVPQLSVHANVIAGLLPVWPWYRIVASRFATLEKERVRTLLDALGIGDRQFDLPGRMSTGQQQRVAIARGLISERPVLLADEPTSSLDVSLAKQVTKLIFEHARRLNATLIFCTHWVSLGLEHADRLIGLREGRLVIDTPAAEVTGPALDRLYEGSSERV